MDISRLSGNGDDQEQKRTPIIFLIGGVIKARTSIILLKYFRGLSNLFLGKHLFSRHKRL